MTSGPELIELIRAEKAEPPSGIRTLGLDRAHRWLTVVEPGHVELEWEVDGDHLNLEEAVICSWVAALADQAMFFASNTLCADGEGTRMSDLHLRCVRNITGGTVRIDARVRERVDDTMVCTCQLVGDDGLLYADVTAMIDVRR
jgi:acyl-coenzyme A thioesterase PaaI-like protein